MLSAFISVLYFIFDGIDARDKNALLSLSNLNDMAYNANTGSREEQGNNDTQRQGGTREGGAQQGGRMDESNK